MKLSLKIKTAVAALALAIAGVGAMTLAPAPAYAAGAEEKIREGMESTDLGGGTTDNLEDVAKRVINVILYIVGILAVVMIIIGGVQYTTSAGDQAAVTKAKNTIMYGLIGLAVAVLAYAIVNFVITKITTA